MMEGMSFGIPLLKFILRKVVVTVVTDVDTL